MAKRLRYGLLLALQHVLPHITLSRIAGAAARWRFAPWKNAFIRLFAKAYSPDMREALVEDPVAYPCFSAFFTRALKPDARPIDSGPDNIVSPADGAMSQLGQVAEGEILQAKGRHYSVKSLVGDEAWATRFRSGGFATIYLAPKDYHRVHMPCAAELRHSIYVPGKLFSVAPWTAERIPGLFARNERLVCLFETAGGKAVAVILVGAMIVGNMSTVWSGRVQRSKIQVTRDHRGVALAQGDELGRFDLGSTVILLFEGESTTWLSDLVPGKTLRMGQKIASISDG